MKQFDRLYKTIFESVKPRPSKRNLNRILKEDVNDQNTPDSITPEQRATIEKVVAKLCAEDQDMRDTVEFAQLDTDFFVALLDGCYEDWLRDEGFDDEQPDMFEEKPGFEEFAYDTIEYYLQDYDADNENTADDIWDNLSKLEYKLYWTDMVAELKPQLEAFKEACKKLVADRGDDTYYLDYALRNTDWWDENGLKYSPELGQEIKRYKRFFNWTLDHCFAADDYNGWQIPDGLLRELGLEDWYHSEDKDTPDLPLESKKVDTSKKVIKESARDLAKRVRAKKVIKESAPVKRQVKKTRKG